MVPNEIHLPNNDSFKPREVISEWRKNLPMRNQSQEKQQVARRALRFNEIQLKGRQNEIEVRRKFIQYLKKWDNFRIQRGMAIDKYIKAKKRTAAFYQLIVLITAHKILRRVYSNFNHKIDMKTNKSKMIFYLKT